MFEEETMRNTLAMILGLAAFSVSSIQAVSAADEPAAFVSARFLTAPVALKIASLTEATCKNKGYQVAVAVVDRYGNLQAFARDPLAGAHTITIAKYKAYTAATFQGATIDLTQRLAFLQGTPKLSLVGGGVPVKLGGYMYGAVGVSGAPREKIPGDVDHACALAGIEAVREVIEFAAD
jgi:uncharacterized protein GlcG (DUF336 family)